MIADEESSSRRRYGLLETVRLYAYQRLDESGEVAALADRHAQWALAAAVKGRGSRRLDRDATNLRAAFDTLLETRAGRCAPLLRCARAVLVTQDRSPRGGSSLRPGPRCRPGAHGSSVAGVARGGRRSTSAAASSRARYSWPSKATPWRPRSATLTISGGHSSSWESWSRGRLGQRRDARGSSAHSSSRDARGLPLVRRFASTHSASPIGSAEISPAPRSF